jgi:hypothetical protein
MKLTTTILLLIGAIS